VASPADFPTPGLHFTLPRPPVLWRPLPFSLGRGTLLTDGLLERTKSDLAAPSVDIVRVFEWQWTQLAVCVPVELSAEPLWTSLERPYTILQHCGLESRGIPPLDGRPHHLQRTPLELWFINGVLHDEPGRLRGLLPNLGLSGPAVRLENPAEAFGVRVMNATHPGMVALEQRAVGCKLASNSRVFPCHGQQLSADTVPVPGDRIQSSLPVQCCSPCLVGDSFEPP
jgi:hypothetical protein